VKALEDAQPATWPDRGNSGFEACVPLRG